MGVNGWPTLALGEVIENLDSRRVPVKEADRRPGPYPYYGASGIVDHVDDYLFDGEYLLIAEDGENLRTRQTPIAFLANGKFWVNNHAHIVRGNNRADTRFLSYALSRTDISGYLTGSTMPKLTQGNMNRIPVVAPPLAEQKAIAAVLGALDDKIELNGRMNATLEAMARALFQSWIQSHANEVEERLVQELIDERTLLIGDGYRAKNSEFSADGLPFVRAGNLKGDGFDLAGAEILRASSVTAAGHKTGMTGDVAFTSKGTVGRITRVSSKTNAFVYSPQVCFWRSLAPNKLHPNVLYRWMRTAEFTRQVGAVSTQTDMAPYVSLQDQRKMVIQLPGPSAQQEIANQLEPIDEKIAANAERSRTLAAIRDTLLPKLLSGELPLKAAA
jgi:type I restriction enzyme S subunit